ncbi:MAG: TonB-dependent receptor [Ignavibacteriales bacterium]|nr:TonB-dependent receptor [Ignavibacteriales bacterium]
MRKQTPHLFKCIWFLLLVSVRLTAQQDSTEELYFKMSLTELGNIVITPSKQPQAAGSVTQKIDVISSKQIESTIAGNNNICEVIGQLPGSSISVLSRNDANWGTYGGIGPKYSTYMLQGVPIDAFIDPMSLDLNAIDRIEVQRGPASVVYPNYLSQDFVGNQSPLAGTVNLILKEKIEKPVTVFKSSFGSHNTLNGQVLHQNLTNSINYFVGSTYEISDYTNYGTQASWLNMKKNPEYKKTKLYAGITLFMNENETQKFTLFTQKTWHAGDAGRVYQGFNHEYETINSGYDILLTERLSLQSHLGIRKYDRTWQNSSSGAIDTLKSNNGVNQLIVPFDISFALNHGDKNLLSIGADYQSARYFTWNDPLNGYRLYGNKSSATQAGVYVQEEWLPVANLTIRGGIRFYSIKNSIDLINGSVPLKMKDSWSITLWSIGTRYTLSRKISLYANGGSSFAAPALKSIGGTILISDLGILGRDGQLPNASLQPEHGISIDGGCDLVLQGNLNMGLRVFYTVIQDAIVDNVVSENPSQTQSINMGNSKASGGEIEISQKVNERFSWFVNGTYMQTKVVNELDLQQNNTDIPFSPNTVFNFGLNFEAASGFFCSATLNYNSGFYDATYKISRHFFKPGVVVNCYLSQSIVGNETYALECFLQLYNITNNTYEMPWQFKNTGFSWLGGLKVSFL